MKENKLNRIVKSAYERVPIYNYLYNKKEIKFYILWQKQ